MTHGSLFHEQTARQRVAALSDPGSFDELLPPPERITSPDLAQLGIPVSFDDGVGIGRAKIGGRKIYIAAQVGQFVGGAVGEIHGAKLTGLFKGYYRNPQASAAAFIDGWFRTGDLATCDANGFYTIVGRIKEMIRRAGENISATEVEEVLLALPGIVEAAAIAVPDEMRGEEVKAYLVLDQGVGIEDVPPSRVIEHREKQLAAFKVPRYLQYRTAPLPRSTSGKVRKPDLLSVADWRAGSWDRSCNAWLGGSTAAR